MPPTTTQGAEPGFIRSNLCLTPQPCLRAIIAGVDFSLCCAIRQKAAHGIAPFHRDATVNQHIALLEAHGAHILIPVYRGPGHDMLLPAIGDRRPPFTMLG
jgi:hypothetical protein